MIRATGPVRATTVAPVEVAGATGTSASALAFAQLLKIESDARRAKAMEEIDALLANEGRRLARARQAFVVERGRGGPELKAATGMASVDRSLPMVRWIENMAARLLPARDAAGLPEPVVFSLPDRADPSDALTHQYPFRSVLWEPLWSCRGAAAAGVLYLREVPWTETDRAITGRLAESIGHARAFLQVAGSRRQRRPWRPAAVVLSGSLVLALLAVPVPMSILAPLEIVPRDAEVVAMPQDGIVQNVLVRPGGSVAEGTPVVRLVDTIQRSRSEVADREVAVAEARVEKAMSLAFSDPRGRQELGIAKAELALKRAEARYARELLAQTLIRAQSTGIAIFSDPKELEGKPLSTGERLMLIGRESETEIRISLPVADSIVLRPGLKVRAFLDADPLAAVEGSLANIDYQVRIDDQQIASYRLTARAKEPASGLNLGSRGTAQILGDPVPLVVYLLRRPLTALRQWIGV